MRQTVRSAYIVMLRLHGAVILAFAVMFWLGLPRSLADGLYMLVPGLVALLVTPMACCMALPQLTPKWLVRPDSWIDVATIASLSIIGGALFVFTIMGGITAYGIGEPFAQSLAVGASLASLLASFAMLTVGAGLGILNIVAPMPEPETDEPPLDRTLPPLNKLRPPRTS